MVTGNREVIKVNGNFIIDFLRRVPEELNQLKY